MRIQVTDGGDHRALRTSVRCPNCGREAVFEELGRSDIHLGDGKIAGQRKCPNPRCNQHLFVVHQESGPNAGVLVAYPPITLDFDATNIPASIAKTFKEAVRCHAAECYVASAIMVRRTLEEICEEKSSEGDNLKQRITKLGAKIVISRELLDAMDELRLLGNDAAHIEAKSYPQIGRAELEAAIDVTKEIMKAVYQHASLVTRLRALKKP